MNKFIGDIRKVWLSKALICFLIVGVSIASIDCSQSCKDACSNICNFPANLLKIFGFLFGTLGSQCNGQICKGEIHFVKPDGSAFGGHFCSGSEIVTGSVKAVNASSSVTIVDQNTNLSFNSNGVSNDFSFPNGCLTLNFAQGATADPASFFGGSFLVSGDPDCPDQCRAWAITPNGATTFTVNPSTCVLVITIVCNPAKKNGAADCRPCHC